jgi:hypothetical protein
MFNIYEVSCTERNNWLGEAVAAVAYFKIPHRSGRDNVRKLGEARNSLFRSGEEQTQGTVGRKEARKM